MITYGVIDVFQFFRVQNFHFQKSSEILGGSRSCSNFGKSDSRQPGLTLEVLLLNFVPSVYDAIKN